LESNGGLNSFINNQRSEESLAGLPMKDIRIIDMATIMAAPFAATLLGDYGAEVIKVENPAIRILFEGGGLLKKRAFSPSGPCWGATNFR